MRRLKVHTNGTIEGVYSDSLISLMDQGKSIVKRASHVEPGVDKDGKPCWYADLSPVNGPQLGPYYLRQEALTEEVAWLNENIL